MADQALNQALDNYLCIRYNNGKDAFPCNSDVLNAVSVGIAAGGLALLFTVYLTSKVRLPDVLAITIDSVLTRRTMYYSTIAVENDSSRK